MHSYLGLHNIYQDISCIDRFDLHQVNLLTDIAQRTLNEVTADLKSAEEHYYSVKKKQDSSWLPGRYDVVESGNKYSGLKFQRHKLNEILARLADRKNQLNESELVKSLRDTISKLEKELKELKMESKSSVSSHSPKQSARLFAKDRDDSAPFIPEHRGSISDGPL